MSEPHYQFVQFPLFASQLDECGDPGLLDAIEEELQKNPEAGVLLRGGIRKLRIGSASKARGRRGGYRVWHYFYRLGDSFLLLYLLDKREAEDISPIMEQRLLQALKQALDKA